MISDKKLSSRPVFLAVGVFSMLFAGIIYAWSILKIPFKEVYGFSDSALALNFTLTMCTFCIGAFFGSKLFRIIGTSLTVILSGVLTGIGFIGTAFISGSIALLYVFYALFAGLGIGIAYNVIISTVNAWFPDRKGLASGALMMSFGASTLIMGKIIEKLFLSESIGWQKTYIIFGIALAFVLILSGIILKRPSPEVAFPEARSNKNISKESFEEKDFTT
ncbi:MAG: MFS transporter, partial [Clostridia bacterium]|nr:MFS transporter [Clostridia bacterium]